MTGGAAAAAAGRGRRAGRDGRLDVAFAGGGGPRGRTVIESMSAEVPLAAQRIMYCDGPASRMAYLYVASVAGGMLQGDRYDVGISAGRGAAVHVTTQGATRVYGMASGMASQRVRVSVADGAYLEMIPDQIIPYGQSRFEQRVRLDVHDGGTMVGSEIVAPGRAAMGESFEYGLCDLRTEAFGCGGRRRFSDAARLEPSRMDLSAPCSMGEHAVFGTVYVMTPRRNVGALLGEINAAVAGRGGGVVGGCSVMRDGMGMLGRMLGARAADVRGAVLDVVAAVRPRCAGERFVGIRKG